MRTREEIEKDLLLPDIQREILLDIRKLLAILVKNEASKAEGVRFITSESEEIEKIAMEEEPVEDSEKVQS